jgi:hypothetical protein
LSVDRDNVDELVQLEDADIVAVVAQVIQAADDVLGRAR